MNHGKNDVGKTAGKGSKWKWNILAYMAVWCACVLWFWLGMDGGGWIMAYTILSFGVILPITTLAVSFRLEWKQNLGYWRWGAMGFFGVMYMAALWATFVLSTRLGTANISAPPLYTFLIGLCPSAIGITFGWAVRNGKMNLKVPLLGFLLLLAVCYVRLKTMNGSLFRFLPVLDVPAAFLLLLGLWLYFRKMRQNGQAKK